MGVAVRDLAVTVRSQRRRRVVLAGPVAGATIAIASATWDLGGRAARAISRASADRRRQLREPIRRAEARGSSTAAAGSPFSPHRLRLRGARRAHAVGSTLRRQEPDSPAMLAAWTARRPRCGRRWRDERGRLRLRKSTTTARRQPRAVHMHIGAWPRPAIPALGPTASSARSPARRAVLRHRGQRRLALYTSAGSPRRRAVAAAGRNPAQRLSGCADHCRDLERRLRVRTRSIRDS